MRWQRHWTPRYVASRMAEIGYQRSFPQEPWLTRDANRALASLLKPTDVGLEFGSGRSTIWFARRIAHLTSVEHDEGWYRQVSQRLKAERVQNVTYLLRKATMATGETEPGYTAVAATFADGSLDFVLVDGALRGQCALAALPKLAEGGILVIDNVNWYLSSASRSPNSRSPEQGPLDDDWKKVDRAIAGFRKIWTSNGVSDTAIYFKV